MTLAVAALRARAHPSSGDVRLIRLTSGSRLVRLEHLRTEKGPDLRLNLAVGHPDQTPVARQGSLGKISKEQLAAGLPVWHTSLHNPDWAAYAEQCGAQGFRVGHVEDPDDAFESLFAADGPALYAFSKDAQLL